MNRKYNINQIKKYCVICKKAYGNLMRECCTKNSLVGFVHHGFLKRKIKYISLSSEIELSEKDLFAIFKREELVYKKLIEKRKKRLTKNSVTNISSIKKLKQDKKETINKEKKNNNTKNKPTLEEELSKLKFQHSTIYELLQNYYSQYAYKEKLINQFYCAVSKVSKNEFPLIWATLQSSLGTILSQNKLGSRIENQEKAIAAFNKSLEIRSYQVTPFDWAVTLNNLSIVYKDRIIGNNIENIEKSIDCCQEALKVLKRDKYPQKWAQAMTNLGNAYYLRKKGERKKNIEKAIIIYNKALEEVSIHTLPLVWSQINHNLGLAYCFLNNIEKVLKVYDYALEVRTKKDQPLLWAETMYCRALAYLKFNINIEDTIDILKEILEIRTKECLPFEWRETKYALAVANLINVSSENDLIIFKKNLAKLEDELESIESDDGNTLLMYAANQGFSSIVDRILQNNSEDYVNKRNCEGSTALICACQSGQIECIEQLLKANADINAQNNYGLTPLIASILIHDIELAKLLINFGSDLDLKFFNFFSPLNLAIDQNDTEIATLLINNNCDIHKIPENGISSLSLAVNKNNTEISLLLIDKGVDLNVQNSKGNTPLMEAIYLKNIDIIKKLINCNAKLNIQDNIGYTALMIATEMNNIDAIKYLIKNNADINIIDRFGNTALVLALTKGLMNCSKIFIENNARVDIENDVGISADMILSQRGFYNLINSYKNRNYFKYHNSVFNKAQIDRHIKIFFSSTFIDMEEERNILEKYILPQLQNFCEKNSINLTDIELRWGITEEQINDEKLLTICFEEIEKCNIFIGILGNRYGSIPKIPDKLLEKEKWLSNHGGESITELEFWKGAFNNSSKKNKVFFYLKDSLSSENTNITEKKTIEKKNINNYSQKKIDKLLNLKNRIRNSQFLYKEYSTVSQFSKYVLKDLKECINKKFPVEYSPLQIERERFIHTAYAQKLIKNYIGRNDYYNKVLDNCTKKKLPLVITGGSGTGKSALLSNWLYLFIDSIKYDLCIPYFVNANNFSNEINIILKRILEELNQFFVLHLDLTNINTKNLSNLFLETINYVSQKGNSVLIVIDDIDQIKHNYEKFDLSWIPQKMPKNINFIVTTSSLEYADQLKANSWEILKIGVLNNQEKFDFICKYFRQFGKTLSDELTNQLLNSNITNHPINLYVILFELKIYSNHKKLNNLVDELCALNDTSELLDKLFSRYESDYNFDVSKAMRYIWASRCGLDEIELRNLIGEDEEQLPQNYWIPFYNVSKFFFSNTSGLINISNELYKNYIEKRYLKTDNIKSNTHSCLANYFQESRVENRKNCELPWHLFKSCAWSKLYDLLSDTIFFYKILSTRYKDSFLYWHHLEKNGYSPSVAYIKILNKPEIITDDYLWYYTIFFIEYGLSNKANTMVETLIEKLSIKKDWKRLQKIKLSGYRKNRLNILCDSNSAIYCTESMCLKLKKETSKKLSQGELIDQRNTTIEQKTEKGGSKQKIPSWAKFDTSKANFIHLNEKYKSDQIFDPRIDDNIFSPKIMEREKLIIQEWEEPNTNIKFVWIPSGKFTMGKSYTEKKHLVHTFESKFHKSFFIRQLPIHERSVEGFWIERFPVTVGEFNKFVNETKYITDAEKKGWTYGYDEYHVWGKRNGQTWKNTPFKQTKDHPVINISFHDANAFANWLSSKCNAFYRIPTEAEWEYSCRALTDTNYSYGDTITTKLSNYSENINSQSQTTQVGYFPPNKFGLYDMHGNVWEWCTEIHIEDDCAASNIYKNLQVRAMDLSFSCLRGGSWGSDSWELECSNSLGCQSNMSSSLFGFRLIKEVESFEREMRNIWDRSSSGSASFSRYMIENFPPPKFD